FALALAAVGLLAAGCSNCCKHECNPCNPCETKASPCNPCATKTTPCNPCETKVTPCNPCEQHVAKPCGCGDPCRKVATAHTCGPCHVYHVLYRNCTTRSPCYY